MAAPKRSLDEFFAALKLCRDQPAKNSHTAKLLQQGAPRIARKLGEEAMEAVIASLVEDKSAFVGECADVLYHLLVLMAARDAELSDVCTAMINRRAEEGSAS